MATAPNSFPAPPWRPEPDEVAEQAWVDPQFRRPPSWVRPFFEPVLPHLYDCGLEFTDRRAQTMIAQQIASIVKYHGPIHDDAVLRALKESWGLGRTTTSEMRFAYDRAVSLAKRLTERALCREGDFLRHRPSTVDVRAPLTPDAPRRRASEVAPIECELALFRLICAAGVIDRETLRAEFVALFGFVPIARDNGPVFDRAMETLERRRRVRRRGDVVQGCPSATALRRLGQPVLPPGPG